MQFRILTSFIVTGRVGLNIKERIFISFAWLPKATVQAAIGPVAYDLVRTTLPPGPDRDIAEKRGLQILTLAVISILLTAPLGAIAIMLTGPKLLSKDKVEAEVIEEEGDHITLPPPDNTTTAVNLKEGQPMQREQVRTLKVKGAAGSEDVVVKIITINSSLMVNPPKPGGGDTHP